MHSFHIGDQVEVLDEAIAGKVTRITGQWVSLETEDGFEMEFEAAQLILASKTITVSNHEAARVKHQKEAPAKRKAPKTRPKERNTPKFEVDLHIHQLTQTTRGMSNFDMLNLQLDTAKRQLEFAIRKRIQKVVFIHGVGEGVLKEELNYLFKKYPVEYYDADYQKYGLGATEVYIFQNA